MQLKLENVDQINKQSLFQTLGDIIWQLDLDKINDMNVGKLIMDKISEINKLHGIEGKQIQRKKEK